MVQGKTYVLFMSTVDFMVPMFCGPRFAGVAEVTARLSVATRPAIIRGTELLSKLKPFSIFYFGTLKFCSPRRASVNKSVAFSVPVEGITRQGTSSKTQLCGMVRLRSVTIVATESSDVL
jgi:hypothetical protein